MFKQEKVIMMNEWLGFEYDKSRSELCMSKCHSDEDTYLASVFCFCVGSIDMIKILHR